MIGVGADGAPGSICPQGWTLPPNAGDGSYYNLLTETYKVGSDGTKLVAAPFDFAYTGYYNYSTGELNLTSLGYYWSRTASSETLAYRLYFYSGNVGPQNDNHRGYGLPVCCVRRRDFSSLPNSKLLALPLEFGYTGGFSYANGNLYNGETAGAYWSRATFSSTAVQNFSFDSTTIIPQGYNYRGLGYAVRCLAHHNLTPNS